MKTATAAVDVLQFLANKVTAKERRFSDGGRHVPEGRPLDRWNTTTDVGRRKRIEMRAGVCFVDSSSSSTSSCMSSPAAAETREMAPVNGRPVGERRIVLLRLPN